MNKDSPSWMRNWKRKKLLKEQERFDTKEKNKGNNWFDGLFKKEAIGTNTVFKGIFWLIVILSLVIIFFVARNLIFAIVLFAGLGFGVYFILKGKQKWKMKGILTGGLVFVFIIGIFITDGLNLAMINSEVGANVSGVQVNYSSTTKTINFELQSEKTLDTDEYLSKLGVFSSDKFDFDADFWTSELSVPDITIERMYDTAPCNFDGSDRNDYIYEEREYTTEIDGQQTDIILYAIPVKAQIQITFEADLEFIIESTFGFNHFTRLYGEVNGQFERYNIFGGSPLEEIGGVPVRGVVAIQLWSTKMTLGDFVEDYEFIQSAIIDAEVGTKTTEWRIATPFSSIDGGDDTVATQTTPAFGSYDCGSAGDYSLYSTVQDVLDGQSYVNIPSFNNIDLMDTWENEMYISIPFNVEMGCYSELGAVGTNARTFKYVKEYITTLDIVYTVLTGYSSLVIDKDNEDYKDEEMNSATLWEKIINGLGEFWNEIYGKIILITLLSVVVLSIMGYVITALPKGSGSKKKKKTSSNKSGGSGGSGAVTVTVLNVMGDAKDGAIKLGSTVKKAGGKAKSKTQGFFSWLFKGKKKKNKRGRKR